jgi:peptidase M28-like protein
MSIAGLTGVAVFAALASVPQDAVQPPRDPAITRAELEAHVRTLASDALGGRKTGAPEAVEAAKYLAGELERAGAQPAGDDGTFLQRVPMSTTEYVAVPTLRVIGAQGDIQEAAAGIDFELSGGSCEPQAFDVVVIRSAADLPAKASDQQALFFDATSAQRREWLAGSPYSEGEGWKLWITSGATTAGKSASTQPPRSRSGSGVARLSVRGPLRERFKQGEVRRVEFSARAKVRELETYNVLGRLRGRGRDGNADLAKETLVLSAHYDHLGRRTPQAALAEGSNGQPEPDVVFNGADDDASGCAAVLELAGALAAGPAPARTVVFLLATGEEIGLVGTSYYLEHPCEPLAVTVANVNFEMIGRPDELAGGAGKLWLTGFERSNLGPSFQELGLPLIADPRPDQNFFRRSDNYAFAELGIVAQTLSSYNLHTDYHTVDDEVERIDFAHMETCVRASLEGVRALVDGKLTPAWLPGGNPAPSKQR